MQHTSPCGRRRAAEIPDSDERSNLMERATFAAGCFWGVEARFRCLEGVTDTAVGFMGGTTENPSYKDVCTGRTGHAEVVDLQFDPKRISYDRLLEIFWDAHDPTSLNRQGADIGTQYRSAIFTHTPEQAAAANASKTARQASGRYARPIVTQIQPAGHFYRAEEYHQHYYEKRSPAPCSAD
jgi:peptide-methionine (S)-S-oxide reductase